MTSVPRAVGASGAGGFSLVPVDALTGDFRAKVEKVAALGGDTTFFQFAANSPEVVELYWGRFYRDLFFAGRLPVRLKEIARLRLAALNGCSFCQVGDRASALENGLTRTEVDALLDGDGTCASFTGLEQAVAAAADSCSVLDPDALIAPDVMARLQAELEPPALVELLLILGVLTGMARMLTAAGFTSRACPLP